MQPGKTGNINFFAGVVSKASGHKHVLMGSAVPSLEEVVDVSDAGEIPYDWGETATEESMFRLARLILQEVEDAVPVRLVKEYVDTVIRKMDSSRMWLLRRDEVELWILRHQVVQ